ncbi:uncharacterized protein LOC142350380 [Convolutriloba macropyga]|uniref:uncharacterized protein LOC142350380 n=1 Tax=Convolutriloba macropyga TaxID=536237 RepID=UPI003F528FAC
MRRTGSGNRGCGFKAVTPGLWRCIHKRLVTSSWFEESTEEKLHYQPVSDEALFKELNETIPEVNALRKPPGKIECWSDLDCDPENLEVTPLKIFTPKCQKEPWRGNFLLQGDRASNSGNALNNWLRQRKDEHDKRPGKCIRVVTPNSQPIDHGVIGDPRHWRCQNNSDCPDFFIQRGFPLEWGCLWDLSDGVMPDLVRSCHLYYALSSRGRADASLGVPRKRMRTSSELQLKLIYHYYHRICNNKLEEIPNFDFLFSGSGARLPRNDDVQAGYLQSTKLKKITDRRDPLGSTSDN